MADVDWDEFENQIEDCKQRGGREFNFQDFSLDCENDDGPFDKGLSRLVRDLPRLANLTLSLVSGKQVESLARRVGELPNLRSLDIEVSWDETLCALAAETAILPLIRYLGPNVIGDEGLRALAASAEHLINLRHMECDVCSFGDVGLRALADQADHLVKFETFVECDTQELKVTAEGCQALAEFVAFKRLVLGGWPIDDSCLEVIARRGKFSATLEELDLRLTNVGDDGIKALAEHGDRFSCLEWLNLPRLNVGDDALKALALVWQRGALQNLAGANFVGTNVQLVAAEVLETKDAAQIFEAALDGLAMPEAKIVVLGEPGVGKSSLCKCFFRGETVDAGDRDETHDFELIVPDWSREVWDLDVKLRIWDFGGQHVLHGTHEMFLTSRSVCLLVLDATQAEEIDPDETDSERDGNRLTYWLNMICHFVGADARIILVITKCDEAESDRLRDIDQRRAHYLQKTHGFNREIRVVGGFSATDEAIDEPKWVLRDTLADEIGRMDELHSLVPREFVVLKEHVEHRIRGRALIGLDEYRQSCRELEINRQSEQETHLRMLHHFGSVFYFGLLDCDKRQRKELRRRNRSRPVDETPEGQLRLLRAERDPELQRWLINPHWLKWPLYEVMQESERSPWVSEASIRKLARTAISDFKIEDKDAVEDLLLGMVKLTELCFFDKDRGAYFFPRGLDAEGSRFRTGWEESRCHQVVWTWDFFPESVIHRFIVKAHENNEVVKNTHWRTGAVLQLGDAIIAVQSDPPIGRVTLWLKKRQDNESGPTRSDLDIIDDLAGRLRYLIGRKPDVTDESWREQATSETQQDDAKYSVPQSKPLLSDTEGGSSLSSEGQLPQYAEKAYRAYQAAVEKLGKPTDREAYDWVSEQLPDGEELQSFDTWTKYLRLARKRYGTSKHSPRAGRSGRSVVRKDGSSTQEPGL